MTVVSIPVQLQNFTLSGAGSSIGDTTLNLKSFKDINGVNLVIANFGSIGYGTIEPGNGTQEEQISFSGITQNADGTATLTGVKHVLFKTPFTETSGMTITHPGSVTFIISNTSGFENAIYTYINNAVASGGVPATRTQQGITALSVDPAVLGTPIAIGANNTLSGTAASGTNPVVDQASISTITPPGMVSPYAGSSAPTGWLLCDGSSVSTTTYASLFAVVAYTYGGSGATFKLPDLRARTPIGIGAVTKIATFASRSGNVITITGLSNTTSNEFQTGQAVLYSAPSGAMTGLTDNTTYYVIRTGNLTFSLATTLANAQNGTAISLSSDGTGTQTFTLALSTRTLGETGGEEAHAMSSTELLAHTHTVYSGNNAGSNNYAASKDTAQQVPQVSTSTGGNSAMNNMQPFLGINYIIKT
jgi:microcystin-dependent protein